MTNLKHGVGQQLGMAPQSMAILIMDIHEGSSIHLIDIISIYIYIIYPIFPR